MSRISNEQIIEKVKNAPKDVQNIFANKGSINLDVVLNQIVKEHSLSQNDADIVADEVGFVLLGLGSRETFSAELIARGIKIDVADKIQEIVDTKIFNLVSALFTDPNGATVAVPDKTQTREQNIYNEPATAPYKKIQSAESAPEPTKNEEETAHPMLPTEDVFDSPIDALAELRSTTQKTDTNANWGVAGREKILEELEHPSEFRVPFTPKRTPFEKRLGAIEERANFVDIPKSNGVPLGDQILSFSKDAQPTVGTKTNDTAGMINKTAPPPQGLPHEKEVEKNYKEDPYREQV